MKRLMVLLLPAGILAVALIGGIVGRATGTVPIPDGVWFYLWPILIALTFLALSLSLLVLGAYRWVWVVGTGFVAQTIGVLMLWGGGFDTPWEVLGFTVPAVIVALLVVLVVWLIASLRTLWLEKKMIEGMGDEGGMDQQELQKIRDGMAEAISLLKRAGSGRNAIYQLPWFLVIGRPQAGKTIAIKNSGLGLPVRKDWIKGVGGTHTADWFFTNDLIFLDTPGEWVEKGTTEEGQRYWTELLRLLRKYRGRQPLDGLIVLVPADDLLSKSDEELQDQASNVREVIDLLHDELRFRFPVYLLVSKCDLVEGFVDFFRGLPAQRRHEILGWSHTDPNEGDPLRLIPRGFQRVARRLQAYRLEMLARIAKKTRARRLFFFPEEFKRLQRPLSVFADILFLEDPANEPPVFRGFYFTSGTQEGSPLGQALSQLAQNLGVRPAHEQETGEEEPKRSYFLLELFRNLMVGDEGLVGRTAFHWWRRRRDTMFVAFLPAGAALFVLAMSLLSFFLNYGLYQRVDGEVPGVVRALEPYRESPDPSNLSKALELTERLRAYHKELDGFTLLRRFGMRRPGPLTHRMLETYRDQFEKTVLDPTLRLAQSFVLDPDQTCADRMEVFYSVIWLRQGRRAEWAEDMKGLEKALPLSPEQSRQVAADLRRQFAYLINHSSRNEAFLGSISLAEMARGIKTDCSSDDSLTGLDLYRRYQEECASTDRACEWVDCNLRLKEALGFEEKDFGVLQQHIEDAKTDLANLQDLEPEAKSALEVFSDIRIRDREADACLDQFREKVLPEIRRYADQDRMIAQCRDEMPDGRGSREKVYSILGAQDDSLSEAQETVKVRMQDFNSSCRARYPDLRPTVLFEATRNFRRLACLKENTPCSEVRASTPRPVATPRRTPRPAAPRRLTYFTASAEPGYNARSWANKKEELSGQLRYAEGLPSGERQTEENRVAAVVRSYSAQYARSWSKYLDDLELKQQGLAPDWLKKLSKTDEYRKLLEPASQALEVGDMENQTPFMALKQGLETLGDLSGFVAGDLAIYQSKLGAVAEDLDRCGKDPRVWNEYRRQLTAGDSSNSLVSTRRWVEEHAGASLAGGKLRDLLLKPLDVASDYVRTSTDLIAASWKELQDRYGSVAGAFPFAGDPSAPLAEEEDLVAVFGGESGVVKEVRDLTSKTQLSAPATNWLKQASALSEALFPKGDDALAPLSLRVTMGEWVVEPSKAAEDYRLDKLTLRFSSDSEFEWSAGDPDAKSEVVDIDLFGKRASQNSSARVLVGERKGILGRMLTANWKEMDPMVAVETSEIWAPMKLLAGGLAEGADTGGDKLDLVYAVEVPYKRNEPGHMRIKVTVEGEGLSQLLDLLAGPFPKPPGRAVDGGPP